MSTINSSTGVDLTPSSEGDESLSSGCEVSLLAEGEVTINNRSTASDQLNHPSLSINLTQEIERGIIHPPEDTNLFDEGSEELGGEADNVGPSLNLSCSIIESCDSNDKSRITLPGRSLIEKEDDFSASSLIAAHLGEVIKNMTPKEATPLLSIISDSGVSRKEAISIVGRHISQYEWRAANRHAKYPGPGKPIAQNFWKEYRKKVGDDEIVQFMEWLRATNLIQSLSFGHKVITYSNGLHVAIEGVKRSDTIKNVVTKYYADFLNSRRIDKDGNMIDDSDITREGDENESEEEFEEEGESFSFKFLIYEYNQILTNVLFIAEFL